MKRSAALTLTRAALEVIAANPQKLAAAAVELQRFLLRSGMMRVRDEQRIYKKMMEKVNKISDLTGMDPGDVLDQITTQARKLGPKTPSPGKDI